MKPIGTIFISMQRSAIMGITAGRRGWPIDAPELIGSGHFDNELLFRPLVGIKD